MNEQNGLSTVNDILSVASGNKEFKVGIDTTSLLMFGLAVFIAMFLAVLLGNSLKG